MKTAARTRRQTVLMLVMAALVIPVPAAGAAQAADLAKDITEITAAVEEMVSAIVPGILQTPRATYLDDYGVVVTVGVALETVRNPFSGPRPSVEVRRSTEARLKSLREGAIRVLQEEVADMAGVASEERVAIIVYMLNPNPVDLPDLPEQLVASVRKQDAIAFRSGGVSAMAFVLRED